VHVFEFPYLDSYPSVTGSTAFMISQEPKKFHNELKPGGMYKKLVVGKPHLNNSFGCSSCQEKINSRTKIYFYIIISSMIG
jgi:hypothetical protein